MTLAQIMTLALRQLDEAPEDISEYDELFRVYANTGYRMAVDDYIRPRETRTMHTDEKGCAMIGTDVRRIVQMKRREQADNPRENVIFRLDALGRKIQTAYPLTEMTAVCEIRTPGMEADTDEPVYLPGDAHAALADYICYRHLLNGSMAKQSRAQQYLQQYYQAMRRICPQGFGSVTGMTNLYAATDIRYAR